MKQIENVVEFKTAIKQGKAVCLNARTFTEVRKSDKHYVLVSVPTNKKIKEIDIESVDFNPSDYYIMDYDAKNL